MSIPIRKALYNKLAVDGGSGGLVFHEGQSDGLLGTPAPSRTHSIYHAVAPDGASFPYVIFSKSSGTPFYTFEPRNAQTWATTSVRSQAAADNELWLFKGVAHDKGDDAADAIAQRLDYLLTKGTLSMPTGGTQLYLQRESDVEYAENSDGETYFHSGALYRLIYSAT